MIWDTTNATVRSASVAIKNNDSMPLDGWFLLLHYTCAIEVTNETRYLSTETRERGTVGPTV